LLRSASVGGFVVTESRHHGVIPEHAHAAPTLNILLGGGFEETYPSARASQHCDRFGVLLRDAGEVHVDRIAPCGALNVVVELPGDRADVLVRRRDPHGTWRGPELELLARRLHRELGAVDSARDLALEGLTLEILALLARADSPRFRDAIDRAREILADTFRDPGLRIAALALEVGFHPVSFARAFRAKVGLSPADYVRERRLEWALDQLLRSPRSIASIALAAGFADQSHFTRAFRRRFGETPAVARREPGGAATASRPRT
jgi:AraC family transcriptional regulator